MHLQVIEHQKADDGEHLHVLAKHILELPRQQNARRVQRAVNGQSSHEDAGRHHAHQVQRRGDNAHVAADLNHTVAGFDDALAAQQRKQRRHGIHQHAQRVRAVVAASAPVADDVAVLRVCQHRIQRIRKQAAEIHDDDGAHNHQQGLPVPRPALYDENDRDHHQRGFVEQRSEQNGHNCAAVFLPEYPVRCAEDDRNRRKLTDAVEHPGVDIGGGHKEKDGQPVVRRVLAEGFHQAEALNECDDQEIIPEMPAGEHADQRAQRIESCVLFERTDILQLSADGRRDALILTDVHVGIAEVIPSERCKQNDRQHQYPSVHPGRAALLAPQHLFSVVHPPCMPQHRRKEQPEENQDILHKTIQPR